MPPMPADHEHFFEWVEIRVGVFGWVCECGEESL